MKALRADLRDSFRPREKDCSLKDPYFIVSKDLLVVGFCLR